MAELTLTVTYVLLECMFCLWIICTVVFLRNKNLNQRTHTCHDFVFQRHVWTWTYVRHAPTVIPPTGSAHAHCWPCARASTRHWNIWRWSLMQWWVALIHLLCLFNIFRVHGLEKWTPFKCHQCLTACEIWAKITKLGNVLYDLLKGVKNISIN